MNRDFKYEAILLLRDVIPYVVLSVNKFRSINQVCKWLGDVNTEYCIAQVYRKDGSSIDVDELMEVYFA